MAARRAKRSDRQLITTIQRTILDETEMSSIRQELLKLLEDRGANELHLNLRKVAFISSGAIGKLITLRQKLNELGGRLVLCNLAPPVREVFEVLKLDQLFAISEESFAEDGREPDADGPAVTCP